VRAYPERELRRALYAQPGKPFDPAYLHLDTLRISQLYQERGHRPHTSARAARQAGDSLRVDVRYEVLEGEPYRVGDIYYLRPPESRYREALGRRELLLKPGEIYRLSRLQRSVERLYQTGLFSQVQVTPLPDSTNRLMNFDLRVRERKPRWVDVGVGSGTSALFNSTAEWGHRDVDRRGLQAAFTGKAAFQTTDLFRGGRTHFQVANVQASLLEPWLFGIRLSSRVRAFAGREDFRSDTRFVLRQSTRGFGFDLFRELGRISRFTLQQESDEVHQGYGPPDVGGIPDSTLDSLSRSVVQRYRTNLVRGVLERDLRDNRIAPLRGSYQSYTGEFSGGPLKGSSSYNKHVLQSMWYTPLRNGWNVAARAAGGVIRPYGAVRQFTPGDSLTDVEAARVPFENRFRLGGVNSLRGYDEGALAASGGGLAFLQGNVELRVPLLGPFGVELFADAGNVWDRPEYIQTGDFVAPWARGRADPRDVRYTYGAGGRLNLPFGPLRVDFARKSRADRADARHRYIVQFAIGSSF
jgi:outer membrane protein insertion porin family